MKRLLIILCILFALAASAATGDIRWVHVETNGWALGIAMEGYTTNGAFNFGFGTNNQGPSKIQLTLTSMGFDTNGNPTTVNRGLQGTDKLRMAYPNNAYTDLSTNNGLLVARVSLSDFVYASDSNLVASVAAGWYSNNTAWSGTITNYSTNAYQKPPTWWMRPPLELISTNYYDLAAFGVSHGATNGQPLACMKFWFQDTNGVYSPTTTVSRVTVDWNYGDASPVVEYIGRVWLTNLANYSHITGYCAAFPYIGDAAAVTYPLNLPFPNNELVPQVYFLDLSNTWPRWVACVSTNGNDATGQLVYWTNFNQGSPPNAFTSISTAANRIAATNQSFFSRKEISGATIYVNQGDYPFCDTTAVATNSGIKTWACVSNFPGVAWDNIRITNSTSGGYIGDPIRVCGMNISSIASGTFNSSQFGWFDRLWLTTNTTDIRVFNTVTNWYLTRSYIDALAQGIAPYSTTYTTPRMGRGNYFGTNLQSVQFYMFPSVIIGNSRIGGTNAAHLYVSSTMNNPNTDKPTHPLVAFNRFMNDKGYTGGDSLNLCNPSDGFLMTNGVGVIQNIIEQTSTSPTASGPRCMSICSSASTIGDTNNPQNNVFIWHNTLVGQRCNIGENAGGAANAMYADRKFWSVRNNLFEQANTKGDNKYNQNGIRQGQWPIYYGVAWSGNTDIDPVAIDPAWEFSFIGLNSFSATNSPSSVFTNYMQFVSRNAWDGTIGTTNVGYGDYRIQSQSPVNYFGTRPWTLPFDINGQPRGVSDPPGAYSAGNSRKGGGFF